jgi:predicted nucleic acid-binding protein
MLVDTNVLLDAVLQRQPGYRLAEELLQRLMQQPRRGFVAWHGIATFYYVAE